MFFFYLLLHGIDGGALGGNGLELVGHKLQVLRGSGLHTENATGGEAVDEVSGTNILAGQLLANQGIQNLERLACLFTNYGEEGVYTSVLEDGREICWGLTSITSRHGEGKAEQTRAVQVSAHLHVTTHVGGGGQRNGRALGQGRHALVDGRLELLLADAVADHHHVAAHEVGSAVLQHVSHGQLLEVGGKSGGAQRRLAVSRLEQELKSE